jgi:hypothetical protein
MRLSKLEPPYDLSPTALEEATNKYCILIGDKKYPDTLLVSEDMAATACRINHAYELSQRYNIIPVEDWPSESWALTGRDAFVWGSK